MTFWHDNIITEFDLICENEDKIALSDISFFVGKLSSGFLGFFLDRFPRKGTWIVTQFFCTIFTGLQVTAGTIEIYSGYRFLQGVCDQLLYQTMYNYAIELIEPQNRSRYVPYIDMMCGVAGCILAIIGVLTQTWKEYTISISVIMAISTVLICFMPESSKWLQEKGLSFRRF